MVAPPQEYGHTQSMAIPKIKATFSLDLDTASQLEELAQRWKTSKSEALRRAVRKAAEAERPSRLDAFRQLQASMALTQEQADEWIREVRAERDAWRSPWNDE